MKMSQKETVLYGGAFHPPTRAHQAIVQACIEYATPRDADVWLLPSANRQDKTIDSSRDYRIALIEALLQDVEKSGVDVRIHTMELDDPRPTQTYETAKRMQEIYPNRRFVWVFGTDSLLTMPTWRGGVWLLHHLPMLIVQRDGSDCALPSAHARYLGIETKGISSTEVRRRLATGEVYDDLVSPHVGELLRRNWPVLTT